MVVSLGWAILAPWLAGALCLLAASRRAGWQDWHAGVIAGYGLFAGYQLLYGLILLCDALLGAVSFALVSAGLAAIGLVAAALARPWSRRSDHAQAQTASDGEKHPLALWLLGGVATAHLLFTASELLHLPVFPWDAWGSWMYRAKVWFFAGELLPMARPDEWLSGSSLTYNATAAHYPGFLPALAMWCALALGDWSETLINLPTLACAVALALALYGQCRSIGMARLLAALAAYALLSIPLVGAHLSLAGYADVWMAGFTGLGLVALLRGVVREDRAQLALGLLMLVLGVAVKREGGVWLCTGLLALALSTLPRRALVVATGVALAACAALYLSESGTVELPLLGTLGVAEGRLYVPLLGSFAIQHYDLWDNYLHNFIAGGSWHLLWSLLVLAMVSLPVVPAGRTRRAVAAFLFSCMAAQFLMFQFTELGMWVEDGTVVNRLPLQMAPAYVFAVFLVLHAAGQRLMTQGRLVIDWRVPGAALAVVVVLVAWRVNAGAEQEAADPLDFPADKLTVAVGEGQRDAGLLTVTGFSDGIAVLSTGQLTANTEDYSLLRLATRGDSTRQITVFWRSADNPAEIRSINVDDRGVRWVDLTEVPEWEGEIMELGLVAYEDGPRSVSIAGFEIMPATAGARWSKLLADWTGTTVWTQRSVNAISVKPAASVLSLPALAACWLLVALLMVAVFRFRPSAWAGVAACALLAWLALDARWLLNRATQAQQTTQSYPVAAATYIDYGDDKTTREVVNAARPFIEPSGKTTIIVSESPDMRFALLRAKYLALPAPAYANTGSARTAPYDRAGFLLVLRQYPAAPGYQPVPAEQWIELLNSKELSATTRWESADGLLLELSGPGPAAQ